MYIETSVVSYLVADVSENIRIGSHQLATYEFWHALPKFEPYVSDTVIEEASHGDEKKAKERLVAIRDIQVLEIDRNTQELAGILVKEQAIPQQFPEDALHIGVAATNSIEFVITWNFKHINNPFMIRKISSVVSNAGYPMPVICSPEEFMEAEHE